MSTRTILKYPDPSLKNKSKPVVNFDSELKNLVSDMFDTMYEADGIGLAAPQIGILKQIITIDLRDDSDPLVLVNPKILSSIGKVQSEEGCLSIPGYRDTINRNAQITVQAQDAIGELFEITADGLLARCIQHEIDHLHGVLFIDHLSRLKKQFFHRWLKKRGQIE
jgi:peptide deformylase